MTADERVVFRELLQQAQERDILLLSLAEVLGLRVDLTDPHATQAMLQRVIALVGELEDRVGGRR